MKILIINGPNMNLLGKREPEIYGRRSYEELCAFLKELCPEIELFQSNHEGDIIDKLQTADEEFEGVVINPAGYSHYSVAIADAIRAMDIPCVEVHMTDISKREEYRRFSVTGEACAKVFMGKGFESYREAVEYLEENGKA